MVYSIKHLGQDSSVAFLADKEDDQDYSSAGVNNIQHDHHRVVIQAGIKPVHKERRTLREGFI